MSRRNRDKQAKMGPFEDDINTLLTCLTLSTQTGCIFGVLLVNVNNKTIFFFSIICFGIHISIFPQQLVPFFGGTIDV